MQDFEIDIVHFHNGSGGGVYSVIRNLIGYSKNSLIRNHLIHAVNKKSVPDFQKDTIPGLASEQVFYYKAEDNFYHTCKKLAKLIPKTTKVLVAHDWVELGMVSNLGLQLKVVQFLHGDYEYYYDLAERHANEVDAFVCISPKIFQTLRNKLPAKKDNIFLRYFPVPELAANRLKNNVCKIIYYVKDLREVRKQFPFIIEIAQKLSLCKGEYFFSIAGGGMSEEEFLELWPASLKNRVKFLGFQNNEALLKLLPEQDIFLLPSLEEGLPVSLVEAMKCGVVPLVTNWDGATEELVLNGITGYSFPPRALELYVDSIEMLAKEPELLETLSLNSRSRSQSLFEPFSNTSKIEQVYLEVIDYEVKHKPAHKTYGSRLDEVWMPNWITRVVRNCK